LFLGLTASAIATAQERAIQAVDLVGSDAQKVDDTGSKIKPEGESEFDNESESFVKDWRDADPDYEDTEFGDLMYTEASTSTKLEMLRLLSKETPSMMVFMHAVSMGLNIEDILQAAVKYEPSKGRDLAAAAVNMLPLMADSESYSYSSYLLEDLDREDEAEPYSVEEVANKFFEDRLVLRPYPEWFDGQYQQQNLNACKHHKKMFGGIALSQLRILAIVQFLFLFMKQRGQFWLTVSKESMMR
jgi:hypothetical protein